MRWVSFACTQKRKSWILAEQAACPKRDVTFDLIGDYIRTFYFVCRVKIPNAIDILVIAQIEV